jgi:hypothetical protein
VDEQTLYVVNAHTNEVEAYHSEGGRYLRHLGAASAGVRSIQGYSIRTERDSSLTVFDARGQVFSRFTTQPVFSHAFLKNGNIVVAAPTDEHLLHLYTPSGKLLKSFGAVKEYDRANVTQNHFLHKGKVLVDRADNIYFVYYYIPLIQKFSSHGILEYERQVEGDAIDIQRELAERFFSRKRKEQVGGIDIINSAAIDNKTGRLWLTMNGSSATGIVYEYNNQGEKIREYVLQLNSSFTPPKNITGVKDIAVTGSQVHVLTSQSQVYTFAISDTPAARMRDALPKSEWMHGSFMAAAWTLPLSNFFPAVQGACGTSQTWNDCSFNCPGLTCSGSPPTPTSTSSNSATQNCKAALLATLAQGYSVVSSNCTQYPVGTAMHVRGGCRNEVVICREGTNSTHTVTLDCQAPTQSCPESVELECNEPWYECGRWEHWDSESCRCEANSPIIIDVAGNGFELTDAAGGVLFDLNGDLVAERLAWTTASADDAWLALDRNGNGQIESGKELFGNSTVQPASDNENGFIALAEFDQPVNGGNRDGTINGKDLIFVSLRLWQDTNHNGISESGELHPLRSRSVTSISLDYRESRKSDLHGNQFRYRAKVNGRGNSDIGKWAYDVFLLSE